MSRLETENDRNKEKLYQIRLLADQRRSDTWFAWANFMVFINGGGIAVIVTDILKDDGKLTISLWYFIVGLFAILLAKSFDMLLLEEVVFRYKEKWDKLIPNDTVDIDEINKYALERYFKIPCIMFPSLLSFSALTIGNIVAVGVHFNYVLITSYHLCLFLVVFALCCLASWFLAPSMISRNGSIGK